MHSGANACAFLNVRYIFGMIKLKAHGVDYQNNFISLLNKHDGGHKSHILRPWFFQYVFKHVTYINLQWWTQHYMRGSRSSWILIFSGVLSVLIDFVSFWKKFCPPLNIWFVIRVKFSIKIKINFLNWKLKHQKLQVRALKI